MMSINILKDCFLHCLLRHLPPTFFVVLLYTQSGFFRRFLIGRAWKARRKHDLFGI